MNNPDSSLIKPTLEKFSFPKTREYLKVKFIELQDDYHTSDGKYSEHCGQIAVDVASLIKQEGGNPQLLAIRGTKIDSVNTTTLEPRRYSGRVKWAGHTVCENDNMIYDPMVGEPLAKETYLRTAFLSPAEARVDVPSDKIDEFIQRS